MCFFIAALALVIALVTGALIAPLPTITVISGSAPADAPQADPYAMIRRHCDQAWQS
jgi:hypothetical protein